LVRGGIFDGGGIIRGQYRQPLKTVVARGPVLPTNPRAMFDQGATKMEQNDSIRKRNARARREKLRRVEKRESKAAEDDTPGVHVVFAGLRGPGGEMEAVLSGPSPYLRRGKK
jgi:hypothetical protein